MTAKLRCARCSTYEPPFRRASYDNGTEMLCNGCYDKYVERRARSA